MCQLPSEASCLHDSQCDPSLVCAVDARCRNQCETDRNCPDEQVCAIGGFCADQKEVDANRRLPSASPDAGGGSGGSASGGSGGAGGGHGGAGALDAAVESGGSAGAETDACANGVDCSIADSCRTSAIDCGGGNPLCRETGNVKDGTACGAGKTCANGACLCAGATTLCGSNCVDENTDTGNCGACGHKCLSGMCSGGQCQSWVVASPSGGVGSLVSDGTNLLWIDTGSGSVLQKPVTGTGGTVTISKPTSPPTALAMANGVVLFITTNSESGLDVWTATEGTSNSGYDLATLGSSGSFLVLYGLAIHPSGGSAYLEMDDFSTGTGTIQKCTLGLSISCSLATPATPSDLGDDIGATANYLFWTVDATGDVSRYAFVDSKSANVATGQGGPYLLALDPSYVYFANRGANSFLINRANQTNPTPASPQSVLSNTTGALNALATDGKYVYYGGRFGTTKIGYVPVGGGTGKPLYTGASTGNVPMHSLVATGGAIYFYDSGDKTIRGIAAPP